MICASSISTPALNGAPFPIRTPCILWLPFKFVGTLLISGDLYGNNETSHCRGEGYVQILGDPVGTIPWIVAVALILVSGVVLLVATPYSTTWETDPNAGERLRTGPIGG